MYPGTPFTLAEEQEEEISSFTLRTVALCVGGSRPGCRYKIKIKSIKLNVGFQVCSDDGIFFWAASGITLVHTLLFVY